MRSAAVFVYGDIGRSPRMQNHAVELSKIYQVYFMGYFETAPKSKVTDSPNIRIVDLQIGRLQFFRAISFYLYAIVRILLQIFQILYLLGWKYRNLEFVLIQNPPSIPNLFAIWLASFTGKYKIYIDFHNYGYTILNLNIKNRIIVKLAALYERVFARKASAFFCVSDQMKNDLKQNWGIEATTLYDRPLQKEQLNVNKNLFLEKYKQRPIQPNELLLVSSTSWTKDQDFSVLLDALQLYEKGEGKKFLRTFITGKGPEKERYLKIIEERRPSWKKISVDAVWLQADDYPVLLSICDVGVCLHYSSSGLDLPMKVVDMFGAGIPVIAIGYSALPQLVKHGDNGFVFSSAKDLHTTLLEVSENEKLLGRLKENVKREMKHTWEKEWEAKVLPLVKY